MSQAIDGYFLEGTLAEIQAAYKSMPAWPEREDQYLNRPRLEAVLDVVNATHGSEALGYLAKNFKGRRPNRVHELLASHLRSGGLQLTANFDMFIEAASVGIVEESSLHHFHGKVHSKGKRLPSGSTLTGVQYGFARKARNNFLAPITRANCRALAFVGYSFSDYFDATPALIDTIERGMLAGRCIIWFHHGGRRATKLLRTVGPDTPLVIKAAIAAGVEVYRIDGATGNNLFQVLKRVGCDVDDTWRTESQCDCLLRPTLPPFASSETARKAATLRLLSRFGLQGRLGGVRALGSLKLSWRDLEAREQAEYWWKKGRYSRGRRAALRSVDRDHPYGNVEIRLVHARFDWIQGRYRRASNHLIEILRSDVEGLPSPLRAQVLERYARVAVHTRRAPDAKRLVLPRLMTAYPEFVRAVHSLQNQHRKLSPGQLAQVLDAAAVFEAEVIRGQQAFKNQGLAETRESVIAQFDELEDLGGLVDLMRGNGNSGRWPFPASRNDPWQNNMRKMYEAVGNRADIYRMYIMTEDSSYVAGVLKALWSTCRLNVSHWNRLRFLGKYGQNRLRTWRHDRALAPLEALPNESNRPARE